MGALVVANWQSTRNRSMLLGNLLSLVFILVFNLVGLAVNQRLAAADKYNVLFILVDDLRPELGCYGAPAQTPNIDKLASQAVLFERAYCQYPLCNPSRSSMLTGLLPTQTKVLANTNNFRDANPNHVSLPELFKKNGYTTVKSGKVFHGGIDDPQSWSEGAETGPRKNDNAKKAVAKDAKTDGPGFPMTKTQGPVTQQMINSDQRVVLPGDGETHQDYRTVDAAIAAMKRLQDQPFFITCGFTKPHAAPSAPQKFYDLYPADKMQLPKTFAPFPTPPIGFPKASLTKQNTDLFWNREAQPDEARLMLQSYRASTSWADWNVGRLMAQLDELKLRDKTIIVFWGDHGYHLGEMGKWSKHQSLFEVGARVPLMISVPQSSGAGKRCVHPVQSVDIYPTLASLCGLSAPKELAGHDLSSVLKNPDINWSYPAFTFAGNSQGLHRSVRVDRWRYVEWSGSEGGAALIDEDNDPMETTNLADDPAYADTVRRLKDMLSKLPN